ncbi:MAG: hypothetical protein K2K25_04040 [Muribaculaceae bacterium]|nr:hypothetical protein [Muribaculaceae bacterium]
MNLKFNVALCLTVMALTAFPMLGQNQDFVKSNLERDAVQIKSYPGIPDKFFSKGDAFISGKITDYSRDLDFYNITLEYTNPITGEKTVKEVPINDDGSFSAVIGMECPGFVSLYGGGNWISARYYAEPSRTLHIEFDFEDIQRLCNDNSDHSHIGQRVSRFGGDTGEINRQISLCPLLKKCDVRTLAAETLPREAADEIKAIYEENKKITEDYIASNDLHPLTVRLLRNELLGEYAAACGEYEHKRIYHMISQPDAPSLKENPDVSFYDYWKRLLTETDEWFLTSSYMEGTQSDYFASYFPYLFDAQERFRYEIHFDPMAFLKSKGAILTSEEEEIAEWFASNVGKSLYLRHNEPNIYLEYLPKVYALAVRSGLEQEYLNYRADEQKKLQELGVIDDNFDIPYNVNLQAEAIKRFTGQDEVPFLWQAIQTYILTEGNGLNPDDYSKDQMNNIIAKIKDTNVISHPVLTEALTKFYEKAYSNKNYELPDDDRGRIIKDIIEPYKGKVVLLDFWGTSCGLCRIHIEESTDERKCNLEHPDFKRIFISSPVESRKVDYDKYVEKNLSEETNVWLSESAYLKVQDLFSYSGLPRYVLIDRDGKVLHDDFYFEYLHSYLYDLGITLN